MSKKQHQEKQAVQTPPKELQDLADLVEIFRKVGRLLSKESERLIALYNNPAFPKASYDAIITKIGDEAKDIACHADIISQVNRKGSQGGVV